MSEKTRSLRNAFNEKKIDKKMTDFVLAMDNYFTLPRLIKRLRDLGIGIVGTARFRTKWPDKKFITQESYEDLCWMVFGTAGVACTYLDKNWRLKMHQGRSGSDVCEHFFAKIW